MARSTLSRRTFLRGVLGGAAVGVGLPLLDVMSPPFARAEMAGPTRFGIWFWGNGVRREHFFPKPTQTGTVWDMPEELAPLADVRPYVSVLSGLEIKTATHPHHSGMTGILTGARYEQVGTTRDTIVTTFAQKSLDQVAADVLCTRTPFRSLEVGICQFRGTDEGTTFQHLSHNGPNNVNPSEYSPQNLFQRLFGAIPGPEKNLARRSILDGVGAQIQSLQHQVSQHDRRRLDQHLTSIREIERRLSQLAGQCKAPAMPGDFPDREGKEQIAEKNRAMSDLLAVALACDLTRSFSVMFSSAGSGVVVWQAGAVNGLHQTCHDEPSPQPIVHRAVVFTMQQLAYFLGRLRDTPEGDSNLLERCAILGTTELSEGNMHTNDEFPVLLLGRGGGKLKGGIHYRSPNKENTTNALLTVLRAAGLPLPTGFGYGSGRSDQSISELET